MSALLKRHRVGCDQVYRPYLMTSYGRGSHRNRLRTVIVVEDDAIFRRSIERAVRHAGARYRCEMCATLSQALAFLEGIEPGDPSIAGFLVDITLGDGSGLEFLTRARSMFPDVPAVVMTGHADSRASAHELGAAWAHKSQLDVGELLYELEVQRARAAVSLDEAVKLLARAAALRVVEVRIVATIAAGAPSISLHERVGISDAACKSRLGRMGQRTGLRGVEQIRTALLLLAHHGAAAMNELRRLGVIVHTSPYAIDASSMVHPDDFSAAPERLA